MREVLVDATFLILIAITMFLAFLWDKECWRSKTYRELWRDECKRNNKLSDEVLVLRLNREKKHGNKKPKS